MSAVALVILVLAPEICQPPPAFADSQLVEEHNLSIPTRDGVTLSASVVRPAARRRYPTVVLYWPYHKDDEQTSITAYMLDLRFTFAHAGYAAVTVDLRGTGSSGGSHCWWCRLEQENGYDVIEWAAAQPWSTGRVGMWGHSYAAITQLLTAAQRPPHLRAIFPVQAYADPYQDLLYPGGMRRAIDVVVTGLLTALNLTPPQSILYPGEDPARWARAYSEHLQSRDGQYEWLTRPTDGPYYWERAVAGKFEKIAVPVFNVGGWQDIWTPGTLRTFRALKTPRKLVMGPWVHEDLSNAAVPPFDWGGTMIRWYDYWLKGIDNGIMRGPSARIYVQGAERWREERQWPLARTRYTRYYLTANGLATRTPRDQGIDAYVYDPTVGIGNGQGLLRDPLRPAGEPLDQRIEEPRSVVYSTGSLRRDLEVTGPISGTLYASSSADDTDWVMKIVDRAPDGTSRLVTTGWLRASHRDSDVSPTPIVAGKVYRYHIVIWPTSYLFKAGHELRLEIASADVPRFIPIERPAVNNLYRSRAYPSHIVLPVIPK